MAACGERGMPAMALLDRHGVYGAPRFHMAAKQYKLKAHVGAEVCIAEGGNYPLLVAVADRLSESLPPDYNHKITHAQENHRYGWTCRIANHAEGLICLTGDENGPLAHALAKGGMKTACALLQQLIAIFGRENVYVELQRHGDRFQEARNQAAISLARKLHLPLLATNGVCYATPAERQIADVFTCIKNKRRLDTAGRLLAHNSQRYVRSAEEMTQPLCRPSGSRCEFSRVVFPPGIQSGKVGL